MILTVDLAPFLQALPHWPATATAVPIPVYRPDQLDIAGLQDRCVFATPTSGPGLLLENAFDVPGCQLRFRGPQGSPGDDGYDDVERMAQAVDKDLLNAAPTTIGGQHVGLITRVGSAPTFLLRDSGRRVHFTGNYLFTIAY